MTDVEKRVWAAECNSRRMEEHHGFPRSPEIDEYVRAEAEYGIRAILFDIVGWWVSHPADRKAKSGSARDRSWLRRYTADLRKRLAEQNGPALAAAAGKGAARE